MQYIVAVLADSSWISAIGAAISAIVAVLSCVSAVVHNKRAGSLADRSIATAEAQASESKRQHALAETSAAKAEQHAEWANVARNEIVHKLDDQLAVEKEKLAYRPKMTCRYIDDRSESRLIVTLSNQSFGRSVTLTRIGFADPTSGTSLPFNTLASGLRGSLTALPGESPSFEIRIVEIAKQHRFAHIAHSKGLYFEFDHGEHIPCVVGDAREFAEDIFALCQCIEADPTRATRSIVELNEAGFHLFVPAFRI